MTCHREPQSGVAIYNNMDTKQYYVYLMTNYTNQVIYIGVTNDLKRRIYQHKHKVHKGFTSKYNINKIVYFETFNDINDAIFREKQLKAGPRRKKIELIIKSNPKYEDLYEKLWLLRR